MEYEWNEWFEHDGTGCPAIGQLVHSKADSFGWTPDGRRVDELIAVAKGGRSWLLACPEHRRANVSRIIRYRVRRPRVAEWLQEQTQDLPAPTPDEVDA